ncbi:MAG: hypothetical protein M1286_02130 [Candidatus Marsarchaeota archaeon]|nr:hypothetical protein [Candidatus Marsarchaeota archaeon]
MRYSINIASDQMGLAQGHDIDASYKDLCVVCDAIRYLNTDNAMDVIAGIVALEKPILFHKFNKHMGSRSELGGRKGAFPIKAAKIVRLILLNAIANSRSKGLDDTALYVVHASANKTVIARRMPSKGSASWGRGMYGMSARTHSDLEYAKVEIGLANADASSLTENMKRMIRVRNPKRASKPKPAASAPKQQKTQKAAKQPEAKVEPKAEAKADATAKK